MLTIGDIASIFSSLAVLVAVIQLIRESKGEKLSNFLYLHEYLSQNDLMCARSKVRNELFKKDYQQWSENDKQCANLVCSSYDQTGILIDSGIIDKNIINKFLSSSWGQSIIDQYEALAPFLNDLQTTSQTGKDFFAHFTLLYDRTVRVRCHNE